MYLANEWIEALFREKIFNKNKFEILKDLQEIHIKRKEIHERRRKRN